MWLFILLVVVGNALQLHYVSPTRVDIVTNHYVRLERLSLCLDNHCVPKECHPVNRVILLNDTKWDCLEVTLVELHADGTTLRDPQDYQLRVPPPPARHYWWVVDTSVFVLAVIGILLSMKYVSRGSGQYETQLQKDRHLATELENVYREEP